MDIPSEGLGGNLLIDEGIVLYLHEEKSKLGLTDYKFYCFNGEAKYLYVSNGMDNHTTAQVSFLTMDWEFAPFGRTDYAPFKQLPKKPSKFKEMVRIAQILSKGIPFLRVDLYQIKDRVFFSELTFYPCSGMMPFNPMVWDMKTGEMLELPTTSID